jgi:hypothetical protein
MKAIIVQGNAKDINYISKAFPQMRLKITEVKKEAISNLADIEFDAKFKGAMTPLQFKNKLNKSIKEYGKRSKIK